MGELDKESGYTWHKLPLEPVYEGNYAVQIETAEGKLIGMRGAFTSGGWLFTIPQFYISEHTGKKIDVGLPNIVRMAPVRWLDTSDKPN